MTRPLRAALALPLLLSLALPAAADTRFVRGDVGSNGSIDLSDPIVLLAYLFVPLSPEPVCLDAGDANDDGTLGIGDPIALLSYLFQPGSPPPAAPFPWCGSDPSADLVSCLDPAPCPVDPAWTTAAPLPVARAAHSSATLDGLIHIVGGGSNWSGGNTAEVWVYDPASDAWTPGVPAPDANTWGAAAVAVGGKLYLVGGWPGSGVLLRRFDPATGLWEPRAAPPVAFRWGHACAAIGDLIFVAGGVPTGIAHAVYDTLADTWTTLAPLPAIVVRARSEAIDGLVHLVGATNGGFYIYDPALDVWTQGPAIPLASNVPATVVRDGELWVIGGSTLDPNTGGNLSSIQVYDPVAQSWSVVGDMPSCRSWATAELIGDAVHVIGGLGPTNFAVPAHEVRE